MTFTILISSDYSPGVLLKFVIFKNLPKMVIFGFIGHAKYDLIKNFIENFPKPVNIS